MQMHKDHKSNQSICIATIIYALLQIGLQSKHITGMIYLFNPFVSVLTNFTCSSLKNINSLWYAYEYWKFTVSSEMLNSTYFS